MEGLFSLKGKVALVTGGTSGIGLMIAKGFVKSGAKVYVASRKADACEKVAKELTELGKEFGGSSVGLPADLGVEGGAEALAGEISKREDHLDILVNNAGTTWGAPFVDYPDKAWKRIMTLNVQAMFELTRDCLPLLEKAASGERHAKVINVSSVASMTSASISAYAYGPSKAAVNQMTRMLASEFAGKHICVNAIAPGLFPSKMTDFIMPDDKAAASIGKSIPLGRVGSESDMQGLSLFLASQAGDYVTGAIIPIDGGELLRGASL
jgi:NAD(P)-dependent dehydrogenase (short-subunit alcohol dehydrogenase family)